MTPRPGEVIRLVAEDRSNGDIGTEPFASIRTAGVHVADILARLGVARRTEAAAVTLRAHSV